MRDNIKVLIAERATEPRKGLWTPPAGYGNLGETTTIVWALAQFYDLRGQGRFTTIQPRPAISPRCGCPTARCSGDYVSLWSVHLETGGAVPFEMLDTGPPLTNLRIGVLERKLGIVLPEGYRSFLLRHNGGRPEPDFFPIRGCESNPFGSIHYFKGIDWPANSSNIDWNYRTYKGRIPRAFIPVAGDGSGNLICLSLKGTNKGAVYFWDHDEERSPPTHENVYLIAETFDGFLDSIYFEDLSEEIAKSSGKTFQQRH